MNEQLYSEWKERHYSPQSRNRFPKHISTPYVCNNDEFNEIKRESKALYVASNFVLTKIYKEVEQTNFGLALFDKKGCLLKLYGNEKFLSWAKLNKLQVKSIWDEKVIGTNAVSLAYKEKKPVSMVGEEHFSKFAKSMAFYFSPIKSNRNKKKELIYGGIAIIGPVHQKNPVFLVTSSVISREISLQFFWFDTINTFTSGVEGYSFISLDQSMEKNRIIYFSKNINKIFKLPSDDLYYSDLSEIIDPLPKNSKFWEIINKKIEVTDYLLKLDVSSKEIPISMCTSVFREKEFHVEGITIALNSTDRINTIISRHAGNNAIFTFSDIKGQNTNYLDAINQAKVLSSSDINILLMGESGVGKDILAQAIHNESSRKNGPFIAVNSAALPKDLITSELFGYVNGAFTGAKRGGNVGKFQLADGGTLFLDEIGDMPLDLQATILRVIENKSFMQVGGNNRIKVDVRIISATNVDLSAKMKSNQFREDLFYRLGVMRINIPPLRERQDDILLMAEYFIKIICDRLNKPLVTLSPEVKETFKNHKWPGNLRELQNTLECIIQVYNTNIITMKHIENHIYIESTQNSTNTEKIILTENTNNSNIKSHIPDSREFILQALELNNNHKVNTAKYLGISRRTLYRRLKKYNL